jgi:hypothetical protein
MAHFFPTEAERGSPNMRRLDGAAMQTIPTRRHISMVLAAFVWVGCGPAGGLGQPAAAAGTGGGEAEAFVLAGKATRNCVDLFVGETSRAGTVCVTIEPGVAIHVIYTTTGGWELTEAHLAAGDSLSDIPIDDKGNSQFGQFEFHSGEIIGTSHAFTIPLWDFHVEGCEPITVYLAAHATLRKRSADGTWQTASAWGQRFVDGGNWATLLAMSLACDARESPQLETCETVFAKGDASTCFIGADFDHDGGEDGIDRWGWTNGPLAPGTGAAWPVYADAGQCDVSKGTRVGSLSVSYGSEGHVQIVFDRVDDFVLDEERLHVGTEPLPRGPDGRFTISPRRYPIVRELDDATHTEHQLGRLEGNIYVAYHAVACGGGARPSRPDAR